MNLKLLMSRLPAVLLLVGSVITAASIDQKSRLLQTEESRVHHQSAHDAGSDRAIKSASSLDAPTQRLVGVTALNSIKSTTFRSAAAIISIAVMPGEN